MQILDASWIKSCILWIAGPVDFYFIVVGLDISTTLYSVYIDYTDMVQWIFISAPLWPMPAILRTRLSRAPRRQPSYGAVGSMGATSKAFLSDWEWCA